ncbi:MAG: hypothetical protein QG602_128 [Verrucomicrobiota bacterium]|nr:hypothetical protein [Verrucomicrobiota bacterium]
MATSGKTARRAFATMMKMHKIGIAKIKAALAKAKV